MIKKRLQLVALLCCFLIGLSACSRKWAVIGAAAAAVGAGTYYYIKGDLKRNYEAPMDKTWEATIKSVEALKLSVESQKHDALTGVIKGKMADEKGFEINLKRMSDLKPSIIKFILCFRHPGLNFNSRIQLIFQKNEAASLAPLFHL
jgi:hypothetical protein